MKKSIDFDFVADLYDYYVTTDMDVGLYLELCKGHRNILELMCGTGRVSLPLIREGFRLTCVDYSAQMLDVFRSKLKESDKANILCQDICRLELEERYDLAFIPFHSIMEITDKEKRKQALARIYEHLMPGGLFFCSLYNPAYRIKSADGSLKMLGRFEMDANRTLAVSFYNAYSEKESMIRGVQFYEIYGPDTRMLDKRMLDISFSVIPQDEMIEMAQNVGFILKELYGNYQMQPFCPESPFMHFLFVKPS